ncbi:MAG: UbiA family prenyltransferase, partial [Syntrophaceae bacterium]|nr:UbiA family prenyltransferase [Syntrophaceae bacterium]
MKEYLSLLRIPQYLKNLFIFLPLFFALQLANVHLLGRAGLAFVFFCLLASGVYIFNDYHDREEDRRHPKKKIRPLAAGRVAAGSALALGALLTAAGLAGAWLLDVSLLYLFLMYLILNIFYTLKLKHVPLLDIFIIALGFVVRIFVGGVVTGVRIYPWIIVMTFLLSLFLALGKRRDDVLIFLNSGEKARKSVDGYTLSF